MKQITPENLATLDEGVQNGSLRIDLAYAREDNHLFRERIYRHDAKLWLHRNLADIVLLAAGELYKHHDLRLVIFDGLRTTESQEKMLHTKRVQDNPHWLEEPRLLSPPGQGGHPRAMAVDVTLETMDGEQLDMGTVFDELCEDPSPETNKAHRDHPYLSEEVQHNRALLDEAMLKAAKQTDHELFLLPQEWWDFRFPSHIYNQYAPLSEKDLPAAIRLL